jgi:hypothetical protein
MATRVFVYEVVYKIFRTGPAIYTAVVVARNTSHERPNREFRVLLRCFVATAWKLSKTSPRTLTRLDLVASPWQRTVSHFRPHPAVSGEIKCCFYPSPTVLNLFDILWLLTFSKKGNWTRKYTFLTLLKRSRLNRIECLTLWQKRTSRKLSKNGGDCGNGNYVREGTASGIMAAGRPYDEFCNFHSVSPYSFGYTPVQNCRRQMILDVWTPHIMCFRAVKRFGDRTNFLHNLQRCYFHDGFVLLLNKFQRKLNLNLRSSCDLIMDATGKLRPWRPIFFSCKINRIGMRI